MKKLLDFDLEIALKEPERVVFADGTKVEDWHYFRDANVEYPIMVQISNSSIFPYGVEGKFKQGGGNLDLKLLPKTKTWWFCVYQRGFLYTSATYESREEMLEALEDATILQECTYTEELP